MKPFFASLFCLLASLLTFVPASALQLPPELHELISFLVPALLVYVTAAAWLARKKTCHPEAEDADLQRSARVVEDAKRVQHDHQELLVQKEALEAALRDAQARMAQADASSVALKRDAHIDAEVVNLIALLQDKGRLVDFLMDDITAYPDAQVGAAARVVHQGCAAVLREYFKVQPVHEGTEGSRLELPPDFDAARYRLIGKVKGEPPFSGTLLHHGWLVAELSLPRVVKSGESLEQHRVIAPAEVELA